jgi:hypothetical protein
LCAMLESRGDAQALNLRIAGQRPLAARQQARERGKRSPAEWEECDRSAARAAGRDRRGSVVVQVRRAIVGCCCCRRATRKKAQKPATATMSDTEMQEEEVQQEEEAQDETGEDKGKGKASDKKRFEVKKVCVSVCVCV